MSSRRYGIYWDIPNGSRSSFPTTDNYSPVKRRGPDGELHHVTFKHERDAEQWIKDNPSGSKIGRKYVVRKVGKFNIEV